MPRHTSHLAPTHGALFLPLRRSEPTLPRVLDAIAVQLRTLSPSTARPQTTQQFGCGVSLTGRQASRLPNGLTGETPILREGRQDAWPPRTIGPPFRNEDGESAVPRPGINRGSKRESPVNGTRVGSLVSAERKAGHTFALPLATRSALSNWKPKILPALQKRYWRSHANTPVAEPSACWKAATIQSGLQNPSKLI